MTGEVFSAIGNCDKKAEHEILFVTDGTVVAAYQVDVKDQPECGVSRKGTRYTIYCPGDCDGRLVIDTNEKPQTLMGWRTNDIHHLRVLLTVIGVQPDEED